MDDKNRLLLDRDLKVLFRHVSKSALTIMLTVIGYAIVSTSNGLRRIQIEGCGEGLAFSTPLSGRNSTAKCAATWMQAIINCDKAFDLEFLSECSYFGRAFGFLLGFKSDRGSPKNIMFRCFITKLLSTTIFYGYRSIPSGVTYLYDFISGYCEATILCCAQTMIGRWTVVHLTLFSALLQNVYLLGRISITPLIIKVIILLTASSNAVHVQMYICLFLMCFSFVWQIIIYDTPWNHGFIMEHERRQIVKRTDCALALVFKIPWKNIWGNKYFVISLIVRSVALFQFIFLKRVIGSVLCSIPDYEYETEYNAHTITALMGATVSSFIADFLTQSGFFTKAGARKSFFFLFIAGNVSYCYFYLDTVDYASNLLYKTNSGTLILTSLLNSFYLSGIGCQHFDLSPTFASAQASIAFLVAELVMFIDRKVYSLIMESVNYHISKYMLTYWLGILVAVVPIMMVNTCFNSFSIQDYNKCTRHVCKREPVLYPVNLKHFK